MGDSHLHKSGAFWIASVLLFGSSGTSARLTCAEAISLAKSRGLRDSVRGVAEGPAELPHGREERLVAAKDEPVRRGTPSIYPFGEPGAKYYQRIEDINADPNADTMRKRAAVTRRYQEGHNRFGPIVLQYTHNLLAQAARLQSQDGLKKVKIAFLIEDGTASYEMAKALLTRFKNAKDNPYKGLDLDNLKLVPVTDKMLDDATEGPNVPKVLAARFEGDLHTDGVIEEGDRVVLGGLGITRRGEAYNKFSNAVKALGATYEERLVAFNASEANIDQLRGVCINCKDSKARKDLDDMLKRNDVGITRHTLENEITKNAHVLQGTNANDPMPASIKVKDNDKVEITGTDNKPFKYLPVIPLEDNKFKYVDSSRMLGYKDLATETPVETLRQLEDSNSIESRMARLHFVTYIAQHKKGKGSPADPGAKIGLVSDDNTLFTAPGSSGTPPD